jgi:hypothetical protein
MGLVAAAGLGLVALYTLNRTRIRKDLPGPPAYPIIGSLHLWPKTDLWFTFTKWRETYGDLVFVTVAGKKFLVLNSPDEAKAILDDRGAVYSDRPTRELAHNIIGWAKSPIMRKASHPHFKAGRRFMLNAVGSKAALGVSVAREIQFIGLTCYARIISAWRTTKFIACYAVSSTSQTVSSTTCASAQREPPQELSER